MSGLLDRIRAMLGKLRPSRGDGAAGWVEPENRVTRAILAEQARQHFDQAPAYEAPPAPEPAQHPDAPAASTEPPESGNDSQQRGSAA